MSDEEKEKKIPHSQHESGLAMREANILILNRNSQERDLLSRLSATEGRVYEAASLPRAVSLAESVFFQVVVVDSSLSDYSTLEGIIDSRTSLLVTGKNGRRTESLLGNWPGDYFVNYCPLPLQPHDQSLFRRALKTALRHTELKLERAKECAGAEPSPEEIRAIHSEIKGIKDFISSNVVKELEKRIEVEIRYLSSQREKQRIEIILKKLYAADDVSSLLDVMPDIKEMVQAQGITFSILDENESLGKYLKPLVWDDAFLSHQDFSKYIALIDAEDFAAFVARQAEPLMVLDPRSDKRLSKRYTEHLKAPLLSLLAVPIMHNQDVIGVLEVSNKEVKGDSSRKGFTGEDLEVMKRLSEHISIAMTKLNLIQYDALTGLLRPDPFFDKVIQKVNSQSKRRQETGSYAIVMGDVDWFKNYNDRNGHESGNRLLRELAGVLKASVREEDILCRYGGEEFLFFLMGVKSLEEACGLTERIRRGVEEHYFENQEYQPRKNLTMSFGVTLSLINKTALSTLIIKADLKRMAHEADLALAEAKEKKRQPGSPSSSDDQMPAKNRVCAYDRTTQHGSSPIKTYQEKFFEEKRKHERHFISTFILYKDNGAFKVTRTINLSLGGVKIHTDAQLPLAQTYELFLLMEAKASQLKGDVIYSEKIGDDPLSFQCGLRFRDISFYNRKILENYLSSIGQNSALI